MKSLLLSMTLYIGLLSSALAENDQETHSLALKSLYFHFALGIAGNDHPDYVEQQLSLTQLLSPGSTRLSIAGDLGIYGRVSSLDNLLLGLSSNVTTDDVKQNNTSIWKHRLSLFSVSAIKYLGTFGRNTFVRADLGSAKSDLIYLDSFTTGTKTGSSSLLGIGYTFVPGIDNAKAVINLEFNIINADTEGYKHHTSQFMASILF